MGFGKIADKFAAKAADKLIPRVVPMLGKFLKPYVGAENADLITDLATKVLKKVANPDMLTKLASGEVNEGVVAEIVKVIAQDKEIAESLHKVLEKNKMIISLIGKTPAIPMAINQLAKDNPELVPTLYQVVNGIPELAKAIPLPPMPAASKQPAPPTGAAPPAYTLTETTEELARLIGKVRGIQDAPIADLAAVTVKLEDAATHLNARAQAGGARKRTKKASKKAAPKKASKKAAPKKASKKAAPKKASKKPAPKKKASKK